MIKIQLLFLVFVGLGAHAVQGQTAPPVYELLEGDASRIPDCKKRAKNTTTCTLINVTSAFEVLEAKGPVSIPGFDVEFKFKSDVGEDTRGWSLYYEADNKIDVATFYISKKKLKETGNPNGKGAPTFLSASILVDSRAFEIVNHGRNKHVLIELDATKFKYGPENATGGGQGPPNVTHPNASKLVQDVSSLDKTIYFAQVKFYYTSQVRAQFNSYSALENHIALSISLANAGFCNSRVNLRIVLHSRPEWSSVSDYSSNKIRDFTYSKYPVCKLRGGADAAVLLVTNANYNWCGEVWNIGSIWSGWTSSIVETNCAVGTYTLAHELGHLMGAQHEIERVGYVYPNYGYGELFNDVNGRATGFHSIMAYWRAGYERAANFFSMGPYWFGYFGKTGADVRMGTWNEDSMRLFNNVASVFANVDNGISC